MIAYCGSPEGAKRCPDLLGSAKTHETAKSPASLGALITAFNAATFD